MKLLFVSRLDRYARAVNTITKYVDAGRALGHEVAVFGENLLEFPSLPCTMDVKGFDYVIFVVYEAWDFPDLPYLAQLLDGMPKDRRILIDSYGRYNETIRVEHDFNHLEKMDGHQGWEWIEAFTAVSDRILQPTLTPLRGDVRSFLFHAFDSAAVARPYASAGEAAHYWSNSANGRKPYDILYVGNNWQRWTQLRSFLESIEPLREGLGGIGIVGSDWKKRPDWDVKLGLHGADVDPALLERLAVTSCDAIPFDKVIEFLGQARFSPIFHRPLFNQLGLVTNRTFETFCADTIPILMLPDHFVEAMYGPQAGALAPGKDVAERIQDIMRRPEFYWEVVLKTRDYLRQHHSFQQRFKELIAILEN